MRACRRVALSMAGRNELAFGFCKTMDNGLRNWSSCGNLTKRGLFQAPRRGGRPDFTPRHRAPALTGTSPPELQAPSLSGAPGCAETPDSMQIHRGGASLRSGVVSGAAVR